MNWSIFKMVRKLRITMWIWFCIILPVQGTQTDTSCDETCNCCKDNMCTTVTYGNPPSYTWTNVCSIGCIDGHRGQRCYELCTYNCVSCTAKVHECDSCFEGFYPGSNKDCTSKCPTRCKTCTSNADCTACKDGYHNKDGSTTCPYALCPENCECSDDTCTICKYGFFETRSDCKQECPSNCLACLSRENCNACANGFYNGYELDDNVRLFSNICTLKCRESCTKCQSYNNCVTCLKGKFGQTCQSNCSIGCTDETCHIESGNCICLLNFEGDKCLDCVNGKYGTYCNEVCPEHCKDGGCNRTTGYCSYGCITNTIIGASCNICTVGMHGTFCNKTCPKNCKAKSCNRTTEVCSDGCKDNFKGQYCGTCIEGKYGVACDQECPLNCEHSVCEKETGNCLGCAGNFDGDSCENCKPGFHGHTCNDACSAYCYHSICGMNSAICDYGCRYNYSGDMCCIPGGNCVKCASKTECKECDSHFFSHLCDRSCPVNCLGSCDISTGISLENKSKPSIAPETSTAKTSNIVLATLLALTTTALFILLLWILVRKIRTTERQTEESSFQIQSENTLNRTLQDEVSEADNNAYEILNRSGRAIEHTYDTASVNAPKRMASPGITEYINLQIPK